MFGGQINFLLGGGEFVRLWILPADGNDGWGDGDRGVMSLRAVFLLSPRGFSILLPMESALIINLQCHPLMHYIIILIFIFSHNVSYCRRKNVVKRKQTCDERLYVPLGYSYDN